MTSSGGGGSGKVSIPPGLGGLFAGGMPKLKPVGSSSASNSATTSPSRNFRSIAQNNNNKFVSKSYGSNSSSKESVAIGRNSPNGASPNPSSKPMPPPPPPSNLKPVLHQVRYFYIFKRL